MPGQPFSHNRYIYSEADPVNLHDPSGRYAVTVWQAMQQLNEQVAYNDYIADIGPKEQLLDLGALSCNYAYVMGPRPETVLRERSIWLTAAGSGSILGSLESDAGSVSQKRDNGVFTAGLGVGSSVFFHNCVGSPVRRSLVERIVDSAWQTTQRVWPNLNTGPKLPGDLRGNLSLKWQNRWPDVIYHNAILQGALRSALLGREVEAFATASFRPPLILPQNRSAMALRTLNGSSGGGPLDWEAPAASSQGAFLSHVSASGWEYGQMEMLQDYTDSSTYWASVRKHSPASAAVYDYTALVLSVPEVQGGLQALGGLAEVVAGGYAVAQTGGVAGYVGGAAVLHGLDHMQAGIRMMVTGKGQKTFTHQGLEAVTGSERAAAWGDAGLSLALSAPAATAKALTFMGKVTRPAIQGAGRWAATAAREGLARGAQLGADFAEGFGSAYRLARLEQRGQLFCDPTMGLAPEAGNVLEGMVGGIRNAAQKAEGAVAAAENVATVTLRQVEGMPSREFARKAADLQRLGNEGRLFKAANPVARDPAITAQFRQNMIDRIWRQYGERNPEFARTLIDRVTRRMSPDHIWELQLGGPDAMSNLRFLDRFTNWHIGTQQIWPQIRDLPVRTPIRIQIE